MSHFTVMVIGENPELQLDKYDENLEMPRYREYTKAELIENSKKDIELYKNGIYAEYLKDPEAYAKNSREGHLKYLKEEFPKKLEWTDEDHYQSMIEWYEPENIDEDGNVFSTCNPQAKWDWYSLGGRWSGLIKLKEGATGIEGQSGVFDNETGIDQAKKKDIANLDTITTYAVVKNGDWFEKGEMGWFGMSSGDKDQDLWDKEIKTILDSVADDTIISIFDCHI